MRPDLMTVADAAAYIGVSRSWLRHKSPERGGPARLKVGARVYYRRSDLDDYLDRVVRQPAVYVPADDPKPDGIAARLRRQHAGEGIAARLRRQSAELEAKRRKS